MEGFDHSEQPMSSSSKSSVAMLDHFAALRDPREAWRVMYPLPEFLLVVLCATLSGMEDFVEIKLWGEQRLDCLRRFLP
jgi:predicted transposase YbfD/YdcC